MAFTTAYEQPLDALATQFAQQDAARIIALPPAEHRALKLRVDALAECIAIALVFLEGFDDIATGGALHKRASADLQKWVASVPRTQSGTRLAGMVASSLCSVLEDYIVDTTQLKVGAAQLVRIRTLDPKLHAQDGPAVDQLLKKVKPSVKAAGVDWVAALALVFGVALTVEESETLVDLITFRNLYIHEPPSAFAMTITGEHIKCWTVAATVLCYRLALA